MKKRWSLIALIILAILIFISSCSKSDAAVKTTAPTPEPTITSSPTPTPTSTPSPTPTMTPAQQEEKDLKDKMELAPDIEGATKVIKEINGLKRVTYERDGEYIGEYKKEVTQTDEKGEVVEVGGVALIASEVEKILIEQLPTAKNEFLMPLAVDISDLATLGSVNLEVSSEGSLVYGPYDIRISWDSETIDVINVIPGETSLTISSPSAFDRKIVLSSLQFEDDSWIERKMGYICIMGTYSDLYIDPPQIMIMGDKFATTDNPIFECCAPLIGDLLIEQSFENILRCDGVPIFVVSNKE